MSLSAECTLHACLPRPEGAQLRKKGQDITIIFWLRLLKNRIAKITTILFVSTIMIAKSLLLSFLLIPL